VLAFVVAAARASALLAVLGWRWLRRRPRRARAGARLFDRAALRPAFASAGQMLPVSIAGRAYSLALPAAASAQLSKPDLGVYFMADRIVRAVLAAPTRCTRSSIRASSPCSRQLARRALVRGALGGARQRRRRALFLARAVVLAAARADCSRARRRHRRAAGARGRPRPRLALAAAARLEVLRLLDARQRPHDRAYRLCIVSGGIVGVALAATVGGAHGARAWRGPRSASSCS
jgi:hypothetical protein